LDSTVLAFISAFVAALLALLSFFATRLVKGRDGFEKQTQKEFSDIKLSIAELDKRLAVMAKDLEHVATLAPVLTDLVERVSKMKSDLEHGFKRLRDLEDAA